MPAQIELDSDGATVDTGPRIALDDEIDVLNRLSGEMLLSPVFKDVYNAATQARAQRTIQLVHPQIYTNTLSDIYVTSGSKTGTTSFWNVDNIVDGSTSGVAVRCSGNVVAAHVNASGGRTAIAIPVTMAGSSVTQVLLSFEVVDGVPVIREVRYVDGLGADVEKRKPVPRYAAPAIINHRGDRARSEQSERRFDDPSPSELVALQLFRKMIPHDEFRRYLRHGFVRVRGGSGLVYQIFRDRYKRIAVWDRGEKIANLCVHVGDANKIPPTDEVVGKHLIVECDESGIWKRANITWTTSNRDRPQLEAIGQSAPSVPPTKYDIALNEGFEILGAMMERSPAFQTYVQNRGAVAQGAA